MFNKPIPIRRICIGKDKGIKIIRIKDGEQAELNEYDLDRIISYKSYMQIIQFLKNEQTFRLRYSRWHESHVKEVLEDLKMIGLGVISTKDEDDVEVLIGDKKKMFKSTLVSINPRIER